DLGQVADHAGMTLAGQSRPSFGVTQLGLFAEAEQHFLAPHTFTVMDDLHDLSRGHQARIGRVWFLNESAITAVVTAHIGKGNKNGARVTETLAPVSISNTCRLAGQFREFTLGRFLKR